jgi:hypothetical protein
VPIGPATFFGGLCSLGGPQSANQELDFFQDDDSYFTLLEPSTCLDCAETGTMTVDAIHIGVNFIVGCTMPVEVSIVEAFEGACPTPDTSRVLLAPVPATFSAPGAGFYVYDITLLNPVCLRGPAFLRFTITDFNPACSTPDFNRPTLAYQDNAPCPACRHYYWTESGAKGDLCTLLGGANPVAPQHWVSGSCCELLPVERKSWGQIRIRYR